MAGAPAMARAQTPEPPVVASVGDTAGGQPMGQAFLGVSLEYNALHIYTGRDPRHVDPVLIQLLRNLDPGQTPVVRIGGNSTDFSWWPIKGMLPPVGISYALTNGWVRTTPGVRGQAPREADPGREPRRRTARGRGGRGARVPLRDRTPVPGRVRDRQRARPLQHLGLVHRPSRSPVLLATAHLRPRRLPADVARWRAALPPVTFIGPALAELTWLENIDLIKAAEPGLPMVTVHRYPLRACPTPPTSPPFATIPNLLSETSASGLAERMAPFVSLVHSRGLQFRVDELNSVSCSGKRGVSDTFASALWMLDTLFNLASVGVDGVNVHTLPGAAYELFTISQTQSTWQAFVHPEYYAMLMFAQAFPPGAQLLPVTEPAGPVKVWATRAPTATRASWSSTRTPPTVQTAQVSCPERRRPRWTGCEPPACSRPAA